MSTLRETLAEAGFHGHALDVAVAVALAESGGRPTAHNGNAGTGDNSYGLFQINMLGDLGPERLERFHLSSNDQLYDPLVNAKVAYQISNGGTNWQPWTTFTSGGYLDHLGQDPATDLGSGSASDSVFELSPGASTGSAPRFDEISSGHPLSSVTTTQSEQDALVHDMQVVLGLQPSPSALGGQPDSTALHTFLDAALAQRGDPYVFGAKGLSTDPNPTAFDCSGLTKWAAEQAGYELPDGAAHQYLALKRQGMLIPVDQAINTPGALLFHFGAEPQPGGEPDDAHVAISLGNGKTIEAANPQDGVNEFNAGGGRFDYAAVLPGISGGAVAEAASSLHASPLGQASPPAAGHVLGATDPAFDADAVVRDLATVLGPDPLGHDATGQLLGSGLGTDPGLGVGHPGGDTDGLEHLDNGQLGDH